jgi:hypothetical protein
MNDYRHFVSLADDKDPIYLMKDGSFRYFDECSLSSEPFTSIAACRVALLDYINGLDTGMDLVSQ